MMIGKNTKRNYWSTNPKKKEKWFVEIITKISLMELSRRISIVKQRKKRSSF